MRLEQFQPSAQRPRGARRAPWRAIRRWEIAKLGRPRRLPGSARQDGQRGSPHTPSGAARRSVDLSKCAVFRPGCLNSPSAAGHGRVVLAASLRKWADAVPVETGPLVQSGQESVSCEGRRGQSSVAMAQSRQSPSEPRSERIFSARRPICFASDSDLVGREPSVEPSPRDSVITGCLSCHDSRRLHDGPPAGSPSRSRPPRRLV